MASLSDTHSPQPGSAIWLHCLSLIHLNPEDCRSQGFNKFDKNGTDTIDRSGLMRQTTKCESCCGRMAQSHPDNEVR
jgi:hypothetical protein